MFRRYIAAFEEQKTGKVFLRIRNVFFGKDKPVRPFFRVRPHDPRRAPVEHRQALRRGMGIDEFCCGEIIRNKFGTLTKRLNVRAHSLNIRIRDLSPCDETVLYGQKIFPYAHHVFRR